MTAALTSSQGLKSWYMLLFQVPLLVELLARVAPGVFLSSLRRAGMTRDEVERCRREILDHGALPGGLGVVPRPARWAAPPRGTPRSPSRPPWCGATRTSRWVGAAPSSPPSTSAGPTSSSSCSGVSHWIPTQAPDALAEAVLRRDRVAVTASDEPTRSRAATEEKSGSRRDRERPPAPEPLPAPVVDNHCHLDIADGDWLATETAIAEAAAVGVPRIVQIGCDLPGARWAVEAAASYDALVAGVALHPNEAPRLAAAGELDAALAEIEALARTHDKVRAVGETGLDHFRTGEEGRAAQVASFRAHIDLAKRLDKTLVIHDRDAHDEVLQVIDEEGAPERWVMHCFSGDPDVARRCLDRGAHLSFAGTVTFKNAQPLRDALVLAPAGPDPGRDRRAVPHADAVPGASQRLLPGAADDAGDGRDPGRGPRGAVPSGGGQHLRRLRRCLVAARTTTSPGTGRDAADPLRHTRHIKHRS